MSENSHNVLSIACADCNRCTNCLNKLLNPNSVVTATATTGVPPGITTGSPPPSQTMSVRCCPGAQVPIAGCSTCTRAIKHHRSTSMSEIDSILNPSPARNLSSWTVISLPQGPGSLKYSVQRLLHSGHDEQSCIYVEEGSGTGRLNISPREN